MYISLLEKSIANNTLLFLKYRNGLGVISERKIEPLAIFFEQNEWTFIAYCRKRNENRQFLLNRVDTLKSTSEEFPPHQFSLESYFNASSV